MHLKSRVDLSVMKYKAKAIPKNHYLTLAWYTCHMVDVHREGHSIPYHHTAHRSSQQSLPYTYPRIFFQRKLGPEEDVSPCLFN